MMKLSTYSLMAALVLAGCSSSGGNGMSVNLGLGGLVGKHVGLGTSVNIPIGSGNKTAENGVRVLEEHAFRGAVTDAVLAAYDKTKEMGKN